MMKARQVSKSSSLVQDQRGFTLLECMMAIIMLSVGVLALCAIQTTYMRTTIQSQCVFQANALADEVLEVVLKDPTQIQPFNSSTDCGGSSQGFVGEVCRAIENTNDRYMGASHVELQNLGNNLWRVTVAWESLGTVNAVSKEIGL